MLGKLSALRKRLASIERKLLEIAQPQRWNDCNCRATTIAHVDRPEEFEAEMHRVCPRHLVRRLGVIAKVERVGQPGNGRLDELLEEYRARLSPREVRLSQLRQVGLKLRHESQEP